MDAKPDSSPTATASSSDGGCPGQGAESTFEPATVFVIGKVTQGPKFEVQGEPPATTATVAHESRVGGTTSAEILQPIQTILEASGKKQKLLFSASLISPMSCSSIFFFGKDIYILKFAANVGLMGAVGTVIAIAGPLFQPVVGFIMEKVSLERFFPWSTWGRRAPWYFTHMVGAALTCAAIFMPPTFDSTFLCLWYLVWTLLGAWFLSVVFTAFEASRLEVYPTKEERSEVEAIVKVMTGIGSGIGIGLPLIVAAEAPFHVLLLASVATLVGGLISLISVPVLRKARLPFEPQHLGNFIDACLGLLNAPVVRHLIAYRVVEESLGYTAITASMYYLTFAEGLAGAQRSIYMMICGMVVGFATVLVLPCWTQFFRVRRPGVNINTVCGCVTALGLLSPAVLAIGEQLPDAPRGLCFTIYIFMVQASLTGQTFWRSIALGWVADEDCHACVGRRREAMLVGLVSFFASIGRAVGSGVVLLGLAACGMEMTNCELECDGNQDCVSACDEQNLARQPASVRTYMKVVYMGVVTSFQVILAILVYTFPIYGARLDAIYDKQAAFMRGPSGLAREEEVNGS